MTISLKIALIVITLIYLCLILAKIRKKKLNVTFSIFWIVTGIILIIATLIPNFIEIISKIIGFETPSNMIFCITIFILFYLIFNLTIIISKENQKNTVLVQEISLLKKKVELLEEKLNGRK